MDETTGLKLTKIETSDFLVDCNRYLILIDDESIKYAIINVLVLSEIKLDDK